MAVIAPEHTIYAFSICIIEIDIGVLLKLILE